MTNGQLIDKLFEAYRECLVNENEVTGQALDKLIEDVKGRMISPEQVKLLKENQFELILKEMWVWNDYLKKEKAFVLFKDNSGGRFKYFTKRDERFLWYENASETNPNEKKGEDLIGKVGYFWGNGTKVAYGKLCGINYEDKNFPYRDRHYDIWRNFSLTPPDLEY